MNRHWIVLGAVVFVVWLVATFGISYGVVEWRNDDERLQTIVIGKEEIQRNQNAILIDYCVSYRVAGIEDELCETSSVLPACYLDAEIGKRLPSSCQFPDSS